MACMSCLYGPKAYTDKMKELVNSLFADELYVFGRGCGLHFSIQGSNFVQLLVLIHGE